MQLAPFSQDYTRNPAPTWHRILASPQRVSFDPELGLWLIAGYDNVRTALSDTTRFSNTTTLTPIGAISDQTAALLAGLDAPPVAFSADPPTHQRIRNILRTSFATSTRKAQQQWGPLVASHAQALATDLSTHRTIDLMHYAVQLPLRVVLDMLGLPLHDAEQLRAWADDFAGLVWGNPTPRTQIAYAHSCMDLWNYCKTAVTDRATSGNYGTGLIGDLLNYHDSHDTNLSITEIAALTLNLVTAAWKTPAAAIGHALHHALTDPQRWQRLAHDDHYLTLHIEETLRHSPPIDGWLRQTTTEVTLDGVTIPAANRCLILIGAGNHDPNIYTDPEQFDPHRDLSGQHLAFGAGPHYCLGAALARIELFTAVRTLARQLPDLALTGDYQQQFTTNIALRQHSTLPATTTTGGSCPVVHHQPRNDHQ